MKKEEYFCDKCGITLTENTGVSLQIVSALNDARILKIIENVGEQAIIVKHLCTNCYGVIFSKEPIVHGTKS